MPQHSSKSHIFTNLAGNSEVEQPIMATDYLKYTDHELVARLRTGDEAAFSEIYERYWDKLLVVSVNRLGDMHEAEECVQDVMHKLWLLRETLALKNDDLAAYLAVAVRNQVFNRRLKRHRERLRASGYETADVGHPSPETELMAKELEERIDQAIKRLPPQCRIVFELNRQEGKTMKEIANELDISENTVKYHLKKANRDIRKNLDMVVWLAMILLFF